MVEQTSHKRHVGGSNPPVPTEYGPFLLSYSSWTGLYTPWIYPWGKGRNLIRSASNKVPEKALKAAFRWLRDADIIARYELRDVIRPIPDDIPKPRILPLAEFGFGEREYVIYEEE